MRGDTDDLMSSNWAFSVRLQRAVMHVSYYGESDEWQTGLSKHLQNANEWSYMCHITVDLMSSMPCLSRVYHLCHGNLGKHMQVTGSGYPSSRAPGQLSAGRQLAGRQLPCTASRPSNSLQMLMTLRQCTLTMKQVSLHPNAQVPR